jgi:hypothetical protein
MRLRPLPLHRWAALVLLAWVFGVATSVANACAVRLSGDVSTGAVDLAGTSGHHHGGHEDEAQDNCLDFCDKSSLATPTWQGAPDAGSLVWLPAIFICLVIPAPLLLSARSTSTPPGSRGGPPIPIAFQRLAL